MKRLLCIALLTLVCMTVGAQNHRVYCEIVGTGRFLSSKVNIEVDFGQYTNYFDATGRYLVDENGKRIKFNSMVDAMNYMGNLGWVFEQAYVITHGTQNVYHFLLSKDIDFDEDINAGMKTRKDLRKKIREKQRAEETDDIYR